MWPFSKKERKSRIIELSTSSRRESDELRDLLSQIANLDKEISSELLDDEEKVKLIEQRSKLQLEYNRFFKEAMSDLGW